MGHTTTSTHPHATTNSKQQPATATTTQRVQVQGPCAAPGSPPPFRTWLLHIPAVRKNRRVWVFIGCSGAACLLAFGVSIQGCEPPCTLVTRTPGAPCTSTPGTPSTNTPSTPSTPSVPRPQLEIAPSRNGTTLEFAAPIVDQAQLTSRELWFNPQNPAVTRAPTLRKQ